jgi:DNA processing protein
LLFFGPVFWPLFMQTNTDLEDLAGWLRLTLSYGVGPATMRTLLTAYGPPQQVLDAGYLAITKAAGEKIARAIFDADTDRDALIERSLEWVGQAGNGILTLADAGYPPLLLQTPDAPPLLYLKGNAALLARPAVAIVGSRNATAQGLANAEQFAKTLADAGVTIVSGMALGIDAAAHLGALAGTGSTIAVIGTGADSVYPAKNRDLAHRIAAGGLILSEFPLGTKPLSANFPRRNRIIAGLTQGTLVVEAAVQSGSLITARLAGDLGREVLAIPGSIHSPQSRGCHALIKQGAKLVESAQDVLDELRLVSPAGEDLTRSAEVGDFSAAADEQDPLLLALGGDPVSQDVLATRTGLGADAVMIRLTELELTGRVARLPGGRWQALSGPH